MKKSINVYWSTTHDRGYTPSLSLITIPPPPVILDFSKNTPHKEYIKCPAFHREFQNTFVYKSPLNNIIDIDPQTMKGGPLNTLLFEFKDPITKTISIPTYLVFFSDESLEMSLIPSTLHTNNFVNNVNIFSGKYNIGKWFRP